MKKGFVLFGGSNQEGYLDLTNPNTRSKMPKDTRQVQFNMRDKEFVTRRGKLALQGARAATKSPLRIARMKGQRQQDSIEDKRFEQNILATAKAGRKQANIDERNLTAEERIKRLTKETDKFNNLNNQRDALTIANEKMREAKFRASKFGRGLKSAGEGSFKVGREVGSAVAIAQRQQVNFSKEQVALQQMFGGGSHIWGLGNESENKVTIHNDLNPSRNGDNGTADVFGFGGNGERSGLF